MKISANRTKKSEGSGNELMCIALAAPEFGPRKLYANQRRAVGQEDNNLYALIWNPND